MTLLDVPPAPGPASVWEAYAAVMRDIEAVGKDRQVQEGPARFRFRGVDDVMNALHGPLARHGLVVVPERVLDRIPEQRATRSGTPMWVVHLHVQWRLYGPDGSSIPAETWGEGQDSGDKATGKAHSMAYKSAMLQVFHVPTEDTDDADRSCEPSVPPPPPPSYTAEQLRTLELLGQLTADEQESMRQWIAQEGYGGGSHTWTDEACKAIRHRAHVVGKR